MSDKAYHEVTALLQAIDLVNWFFVEENRKNPEKNKTSLWFATENPQLGGIAPMKLIKLGRSDKLLKFIRAMISENMP